LSILNFGICRETTMLSSQRLFVFPLLMCLLVFGLTWYDTVHMHALTAPLNEWAQRVIAVSAYPPSKWQSFYYHGLHVITSLGDKFIFISAVTLLMTVLFQKRELKAMVYCAMIIFIGLALTHFFKHEVYSPRPAPFNVFHDSFPSGHTMHAVLWCGLFLLIHEFKAILLPRAARYVLIMIPLLVGFSRVGLGRHWWNDVVGAYALGLSVLLFVYLNYNIKKAN
jgi:membrane-associated phospholipid phosphatase